MFCKYEIMLSMYLAVGEGRSKKIAKIVNFQAVVRKNGEFFRGLSTRGYNKLYMHRCNLIGWIAFELSYTPRFVNVKEMFPRKTFKIFRARVYVWAFRVLLLGRLLVKPLKKSFFWTDYTRFPLNMRAALHTSSYCKVRGRNRKKWPRVKMRVCHRVRWANPFLCKSRCIFRTAIQDNSDDSGWWRNT